MAEGSPNDSAPPAGEGTPPETPAATPESTDETPPTQSVEEVEAIWKNRVAGKDRAHNAETTALRQQITSLEARAGRPAGAEGNGTEPNEWKDKYEDLAKTREDERIAHLTEVRSAKYPLAAEALEAGVIVQMDEGKLAALNARLDGGDEPPPRIDPNAPRRTPATPPKSDADKTVAELESDLKRYEPEFADRIANT